MSMGLAISVIASVCGTRWDENSAVKLLRCADGCKVCCVGLALCKWEKGNMRVHTWLASEGDDWGCQQRLVSCDCIFVCGTQRGLQVVVGRKLLYLGQSRCSPL